MTCLSISGPGTIEPTSASRAVDTETEPEAEDQDIINDNTISDSPLGSLFASDSPSRIRSPSPQTLCLVPYQEPAPATAPSLLHAPDFPPGRPNAANASASLEGESPRSLLTLLLQESPDPRCWHAIPQQWNEIPALSNQGGESPSALPAGTLGQKITTVLRVMAVLSPLEYTGVRNVGVGF
jgi:hypothetical protein